MSFAIVIDSAADIPAEEREQLDVTLVPLNVEIDDKIFVDQITITNEEFFDRMDASKALPKTSQPRPVSFSEAYAKLYEQGFEDVIVITIAATLSGTIQSAHLAAQEAAANVRVLDSCTCSAGQAMLIMLACQLRDAGAGADEAFAQLEAARSKVGFFVAPEKLDNLLGGGRLSKDEADTATMLNIKPVISLRADGTLITHGKARGMHGVVKKYVEIVQERTAEMGKQKVRVFHARNPKVAAEVHEALEEAGIDYINCGDVTCGTTIATHVGTRAVGIALFPAEA